MQPREAECEEQGLIKSTLEETLQTIDDRVKLIHSLHFSLESELIKSNDTIKTISDIMTGLGVYYFSESPVQPNLRDLYTPQHQPVNYRFVLPPPSEGQESVNQHETCEPSFKWISKAIIDSTLLTLDQIEAKKPEKGKVPVDWLGCLELLVYNISKKINLKQEVKSVQKYLQNSLYKSCSVKIAKTQEIYYKGKPSILIRFPDEQSCFQAYFSLVKQDVARKQHLGSDSDMFRVVSNRIKNMQQQKWVAVLFRKLPVNLTKETFLLILRKRNVSPIWMEDLIQIDNFKYTLCKVDFLDDAFELCSRFQINSPLKEVKVNLHPKSSKTWKKRDHEQFLT